MVKMSMNKMSNQRLLSSWETYLQEHQNPMNRKMHFLGAILGPSLMIAGMRRRSRKLIWAGVPSSLLISWLGHLIFEKNQPKTFFRAPMRGFYYLYRLLYKAL